MKDRVSARAFRSPLPISCRQAIVTATSSPTSVFVSVKRILGSTRVQPIRPRETTMSKITKLGLLAVSLWLAVASSSAQAVWSANVERAQQLLTELSYDPGPIDGVFGRRTHKAIEQFQRDSSLTVTGKIDDQLLQVLKEARDASSAGTTIIPEVDRESIGRVLQHPSYDETPTDGSRNLWTGTGSSTAVARPARQDATPRQAEAPTLERTNGARTTSVDLPERLVLEPAGISPTRVDVPAQHPVPVEPRQPSVSQSKPMAGAPVTGARSPPNPASRGDAPPLQLPEKRVSERERNSNVGRPGPVSAAAPSLWGLLFSALAPLLLAVLTYTAIRWVRMRDPQWLKEHGDLSRLRRLLVGATRPETRVAAARAIVQLPDPGAIDALIEATVERDPIVLKTVLNLLGNRGNARAVQSLGRIATSADRHLVQRERAVVALGKIGDPDALPFLERAWVRADWLLRARILDALGSVSHPSAVASIEAFATSEQTLSGADAGGLEPVHVRARLLDDARDALARLTHDTVASSSLQRI